MLEKDHGETLWPSALSAVHWKTQSVAPAAESMTVALAW